ncbi:STT3 domain-containing protein [Desulfovibrio legallii]|uniref:Dolichyl-diphosphooligosaccharide--protein glycosyltransferase n=1 Tax=Desulfovibrio legallii TaxID=571438 RepID=A0A1G7R5E5_9BACT|nr:STT3 domain-containing protein [Desulfovibrio legallii]SDG05953.1 dolichyl-diphosphooligosaccharide--protein glycosyltransferase [Desulfovibrio legallii]
MDPLAQPANAPSVLPQPADDSRSASSAAAGLEVTVTPPPAVSLPRFWLRGLFWGLVTLALAFGLRMLEWPCWQNPEYRLGQEWLLATHDAYHWVAGAEGFGRAVGHPMAVMLKVLADLLHTYPAAVAFWFPPVLASLVAVIVFAWVWALGSLEAGVAAGVLTTLAPGFLARTMLGYYDTDLVTLFFPLLMTLAPASWAMRYMLLPGMVLRRLALGAGQLRLRHLFRRNAPPPLAALLTREEHLGNPLRWQWVVLLSCSGVVSWWTQEWHSVFPYLIRYNVGLLAFMSLVMAPRGRRGLLLLGSLAYALPTLAGPAGLLCSLALLTAGTRPGHRLLRLLCRPWALALLWLGTAALMLQGDILTTIVNQANAYLKHAGDVKSTGEGAVLVYPSVAQSIIEVQDLSLAELFPYFHPWMEAAVAGLLGFILVAVRRPGALFLLPLAALALLSTKLGGRMVMFGAPVAAVGLTLPLFWLWQRLLRARLRGSVAGLLTSGVLLALLVAPFVDMIPAMSQGPMINRRHADALTRARTMTPENSMLWLWWDWGYAAHHFARRPTIADGAEHAGPSLYLPAAVFATDNPRFARQLIRYTAQCGNEPGKVFEGLDGREAQALMDKLRSPETPLIAAQGRVFLVVSFEMLRLGFWISNFGSWNFVTRSGEGGALSIVPQALAYKLDSGEVRLEGSTSAIYAASISVFEETGVSRRDYVQEWFAAHPKATQEEQNAFLAGRRNVNFLFNRVTGEKLAVDARLYNSLMVQLLMGDAHNPRFSPYFKLVYDNVFARIYEVL